MYEFPPVDWQPSTYCDYEGCYETTISNYAGDVCPAGYDYIYATTTTCGAVGIYDGWSGPAPISTPPVSAALTCAGSTAGHVEKSDPPQSGSRNGWFSVDTHVGLVQNFDPAKWTLKVGAEAKVHATMAGLSGDVMKAEAALTTTVFGGATHGVADQVQESYVRLNVLGIDVMRFGKVNPSDTTPTSYTPPALTVNGVRKDMCTWFNQVGTVWPGVAGQLIRGSGTPSICSSWPVVKVLPKATLKFAGWTQPMTFFEAPVVIPLGPGTVNLFFSAGGKIAVDLAMAPVKADNSGKLLGGTFKLSPNVGVWIHADISVNFWVVGAGVSAQVNLITASYNPSVTALFENPDDFASRLNWDFDHHAQTKGLDGYVEPYVRIFFAKFRKKWEWGPAWSWNSQTIPSSPQCAQVTCGNGTCQSGETPATCPSDCVAPPPPPPPSHYCGDGSCTYDETSWCPEDCGPNSCNSGQQSLHQCLLQPALE